MFGRGESKKTLNIDTFLKNKLKINVETTGNH